MHPAELVFVLVAALVVVLAALFVWRMGRAKRELFKPEDPNSYQAKRAAIVAARREHLPHEGAPVATRRFATFRRNHNMRRKSGR